jgi:hypothetical protein
MSGCCWGTWSLDGEEHKDRAGAQWVSLYNSLTVRPTHSDPYLASQAEELNCRMCHLDCWGCCNVLWRRGSLSRGLSMHCAVNVLTLSMLPQGADGYTDRHGLCQYRGAPAWRT